MKHKNTALTECPKPPVCQANMLHHCISNLL